MTSLVKISALLTLTVALAACGEDPSQRALTGGGLGAAGGAIGGALVGAPLAGALIGGAGGAAIGAISDPNKINLSR
jgi:hypothetical protein